MSVVTEVVEMDLAERRRRFGVKAWMFVNSCSMIVAVMVGCILIILM